MLITVVVVTIFVLAIWITLSESAQNRQDYEETGCDWLNITYIWKDTIKNIFKLKN